jgi:hemolysin activation/secretion protein
VTRIYYQGGKVYNKNLFKNELYQIGGYKTLRGFNEAALFVKDYHILTVEPRYYISRNSFLHVITDIGMVRPQEKFLFASGLGAGLTLDLKAGMFNILYAIGNNLENEFLFRNAKIHFGYINRF